MTTETQPAPTEEPRPNVFISAALGGLLGLGVMFMPPHGITLLAAPVAGGVFAGMRSRARGGDALVIGGMVGFMLVAVLAIVALVMLYVSQPGEGASSGMQGQIKEWLQNKALVVAILGGVWIYGSLGGMFGGWLGGVLKRMD